MLNSHEPTSKNFQTPLNIFISGLSASAIFPASVKAISSIVPTAAIPEKTAILMAQQPQEIQFKRGACSAEVKGGVSCGASRIEYRDGQDARPTIIVEKLTVKLDAQQLSVRRSHDL